MEQSGEVSEHSRWIAHFRHARRAFETVRAALSDPTAVTPAAPWTAADVIAHVLSEVPAKEELHQLDLVPLQMSTLDLVVHSWDLAVSQGQQPDLDEDLCHSLYETFTPYAVLMGQDGAFAPPLEVAVDASPMEQLVALCGRDPSWSTVH